MKQIRFHQGDVQGRSIAKLPQRAARINNKPIALGEHSGHMHVLTGNVELFELDGKIFAAVGSEGARLQHVHESNFAPMNWATTEELPIADHGSHMLQEGVYEFHIQNAYNPYSKLMEQVLD